MYHPHSEKPAYTLNTLTALHDGATNRGQTVTILIMDDINLPYTACLRKVGPSGLFVTTGDGTVMSDINPYQVVYAEVV